jgi:hypothetical protein
MIPARRYHVIYEGGRRGTVEAEDSVSALTLAQRIGVVWSLWRDPGRVCRFWMVM